MQQSTSGASFNVSEIAAKGGQVSRQELVADRRQAGPILSTHSYAMRRGRIGATRQRTYATNVATASSRTVVMAEPPSPRIR